MVFYTEDTVSDLQQNFFKNNSHNGATINHDKNIRNDIYAFESWIVKDPEKDKAKTLGMAVEKGDWVLGQKVDNPEVWNDIKNGKLKGFSIEAYLEPILTNTKTEMTVEEIDARIKTILMESEEEKAAKLKEEEEAEKLAMEGAPPAPAEEEPKEPEMSAEEMQGKIAELEAENNDLKAKLAEYEAKETTMSEELAAAKKVAVEMGEELAKGIKPNTKSFDQMTPLEKFRATK
jgi:ribosomal protein L29